MRYRFVMMIKTGTRFGTYKITAPLGKGGMGEVYLAEDTRLKRKVALKLLPTEFTMDAERLRRFEQEAQATSALNHPNIITIHEIGAQNTAHYIATEFIAGQTLRDHLQQPLSPTEALDIALQIGNALAAAHEAGIIHRDIKPENVMLRTDGIVKVLDFGLAKLTEVRNADFGMRNEDREDDVTLMQSPDGNPHLTMPGTVMGTASYMSPEQARGQKVDARTDIFSLGVVLYEMLAAQRPFDGVNMIDVLGAILNQEPVSLVNVPDELQRIVTKALQKDRDNRYQTAQELVRDLKELKEELAYQARAALGESPHLRTQAPRVPLASENDASNVVRKNAENEAISSRGEQATLHALAAREARAFSELRAFKRKDNVLIAVIALVLLSLAAFFYFKRQPALTDKDTILLADFTNTTGDAVFDGTLKQALAVHLGQSPFLNLFADERVRETLRLMDKSPDEHITPTVGREICQRQGLKALLTGSIASLGRNYVISLEAVNGQTGDVLAREQGEAEGKEQVLRTLSAAASRLREKLGESLSSIQKFDVPLQQATTSSLEALKAYSLGFEKNTNGKPLEAIPFLKQAIELDLNFATAHASLAAAYVNSRQIALAVESAQKAFDLRERISQREKLLITASYYSYVTGEVNEEIEALELCKQTYPRDSVSPNNLGTRYNLLGQFEKAIEVLREAIRRNPNVGNPYSNLNTAFLRLNRFDEARAISQESLTLKLDSVNLRRNLYHLALIRGDTAAMAQQVDWASARPGEYAHLTWQSGAAAFAGQWKKAQEFSNRAVELSAQRNLQEAAADITSSNAEWAAVLGHCQ